MTDEEQRSGTSYIRWGRKTCKNAKLVYTGICLPHVCLTHYTTVRHQVKM